MNKKANLTVLNTPDYSKEIVEYNVEFTNGKSVTVKADNYFFAESLEMYIFIKRKRQVLAVPYARVLYIDVVEDEECE